jgi:formate dehydrogenase iron-sulfur subunit
MVSHATNLPESGVPEASRAAFGPQRMKAGGVHEFLAELLAEQGRLDTPVAHASRAYEKSRIENPKSKIFESLIPLTRPRTGEQYAFEVDLDACTGCKACVSACHALNGLDENETWRETGQLLGCGSASPVVQTITTACHHCADPGCLNGCPVLAYEKDPLTGIVRHLDDQCIGCQYCVLKCPYDVPKYNARLGIVRKCDLCHQRLVHGEAPACAQACPTQAIRVIVVSTGESAFARDRRAPLSSAALDHSRSGAHVSKLSVVAGDSDDHPTVVASRGETDVSPGKTVDDGEHGSLAAPSAVRAPKSAIAFPGPDPTYTRPTTRYVTARELSADLRAADAGALRPQPAHWPLVVMLTLLPWAICFQALLLTPLGEIASQQAALATAPWPSPSPLVRAPRELVTYYVTNPPGQLALFPLVLGALGLAAATFHLGQPLRAWRVFLGLRTSWFSREAVLFGAWFGLTVMAALFPRVLAVTALAAATGLAALACSVMIYVDTRRSFWRATSTAPRFVLGGAMLALTSIDFATPVSAADGNITYYVKSIMALLLVVKLAVELVSLCGESTSARLQRGPLFGALCVRLGLAVGAVVAFAFVAPAAAEPDLAYYVRLGTPLALLLAGEVAERYLFFRAVDAPKMPGYASR